MKKRLLLTLLSLFFILSVFAQVEMSALSFGEKKQLRKALKVEAYTLDGNQHKGYLYYADSDNIYLTDNPFENGKLTEIKSLDLYQIKVISHIPFGKRFLGGITFSAAVMAILTAEMYSHGDAIMIGPDFVFIAGTAFFGTPVGFLSAAIFPKERTDFEYITDGQDEAFKITSTFFEKRRFTSIHPNTEYVEELHIVKNDEGLKNVLEPLKSLHPEAIRSFHLMFGTSFTINNLGKQLGGVFSDTQGLETGYYRSDRISLTGKLQLNVNDHIRPYLSFTFGETGYASGELLPERDEPEYIYNDYSISYGHLGADYVLNPINNMGLSSFEFSINGGLSFAKLNYDYTSGQTGFFSQPKNTSYTSFGLQLGGRVDYYISRSLSINLGLTTDIMYPIKLDDMHYESATAGSLVFDGGWFNTSNGQIHFGLSLHL